MLFISGYCFDPTIAIRFTVLLLRDVSEPKLPILELNATRSTHGKGAMLSNVCLSFFISTFVAVNIYNTCFVGRDWLYNASFRI